MFAAASRVDIHAATVAVSLDAIADPTSNFIAYWSEGICQLNMTYPGTTRQPFWNTQNLSQTYNNNFDFFPNDSAMKFGNFTYDDASLVGGSGSATITGLTLGIERDPLNANYVNGSWLSFTTDVQSYSGSVTVANGAVTGINLTANYNSVGYFGSVPANGSGVFSIAGNEFQVTATAYNAFFGPYDPQMAWDWSGVISSVTTTPPPVYAADFDGNGYVDGVDLSQWKLGMGIASGATKNQGDANGDGVVDGADFLAWQREFGLGTPPTLAALSSVPEPAAATLLTLALASLALRRQR
ncbi:dockerin type I domain-containing protein [Lacipirellula sp.]|uniref:dockerin type I domain-containing protein n=1 Tax=Lacipirellula sp. TaxID=2691419 RepID=UPI003D0DC02E